MENLKSEYQSNITENCTENQVHNSDFVVINRHKKGHKSRDVADIQDLQTSKLMTHESVNDNETTKDQDENVSTKQSTLNSITLDYKHLDNSATSDTQTNFSNESKSTKCAWKSIIKNDKTSGHEINECYICYQPWCETKDEKIVLEECGHSFHSKCIRIWMADKNTCPYCTNFSLLPDDFPRLI